MQASDERVRAMLRGRREVREVVLPGLQDGQDEITAGVRCLLEEEIDAARLDAVQYVTLKANKLRLDPAMLLSIDAELLDREIERQLVYRAFLDLERKDEQSEYEQFFQSPQAIRQLDSVIVRALFGVYVNHQNYVNPFRKLDDDELSDLVEELGKERGAEATLGQYDALSLRRLAHTLAAQLRIALAGK